MSAHKETPKGTAQGTPRGTAGPSARANPAPEEIASRLARVRERIRSAEQASGRAAGNVTLLAASKAQPVEAMRVLAGLGQHVFGENYVQEALDKMEALPGLGIEWHFIGALQSNKTRAVATRFAWAHAVDRFRIARRLSDQRPPGLEPLNVCLEVNVDREASKSGVDPERLTGLALQVAELPRLKLRGLMAIPAARDDEASQREPFRRLHELKESVQSAGVPLDTLSMGMTADLEAAVAEGATIVRVGTALFGPRPPKQ